MYRHYSLIIITLLALVGQGMLGKSYAIVLPVEHVAMGHAMATPVDVPTSHGAMTASGEPGAGCHSIPESTPESLPESMPADCCASLDMADSQSCHDTQELCQSNCHQCPNSVISVALLHPMAWSGELLPTPMVASLKPLFRSINLPLELRPPIA
jgi:hypothetical protein